MCSVHIDMNQCTCAPYTPTPYRATVIGKSAACLGLPGAVDSKVLSVVFLRHRDRFVSQHFCFPLSAQFHQCSTFIYTLKAALNKRTQGAACGPSDTVKLLRKPTDIKSPLFLKPHMINAVVRDQHMRSSNLDGTAKMNQIR
jgi:hypothetical protein